MMRIAVFSDPVGLAESFGDTSLSARDRQFFKRRDYAAELVEAFREGAEGITRDLTIERREWPFELEDIHAPKVLIFHGEEDAGVDPRVAHYVCGRIPSCDEPTILPGEGHSVVYYRYEEIIRAMLDTWK
jgi:pimeloyl-ACP methyl ester carboxylesterase